MIKNKLIVSLIVLGLVGSANTNLISDGGFECDGNAAGGPTSGYFVFLFGNIEKKGGLL